MKSYESLLQDELMEKIEESLEAPMAAGGASTRAKQVQEWDWGFRNGWYEMPTGDQALRIRDLQSVEGDGKHTVQDSYIWGTNGDQDIDILGIKHHAVVNSTISTGAGGTKNIWIQTMDAETTEYAGSDFYDRYGSLAGKGFGMINSLVMGEGTPNRGTEVVIQADICGVTGTIPTSGTSIMLGDSFDKLYIHGDYRAMHKASAHMGDGYDAAFISSYYDTVMYDSAINLGDGRSTLEIKKLSDTVRGEDATKASLLQDSYILTGSGENTINLFGRSGSEYAVSNSYFILGREGKDSITLDTRSGGLLESHVVLDDYTALADNKTVTLKNDGSGDMLHNSTIILNNGNDAVTLQSTGASQQFYAMYDSHIHTGEGNDSITISVQTTGNTVLSRGVVGGDIDMADGNDVLKLSSDTLCLKDSELRMGNGNDLAILNAKSGYATDHATIDLGNGNDTLEIRGGNYYLEVNAGAGNDVVIFKGDDQNYCTYTNVHMGSGNDILRFEEMYVSTGSHFEGGTNQAINFANGMLGDILSIDSRTGANLLAVDNSQRFTGFEALNVDYSSNSQDRIDLDWLLAKTATAGLGVRNGIQSLILTGDTSGSAMRDIVDMGEASLRGNNIQVEGFDSTFSWYTTTDSSNQTIQVYLETGLGIA